MQKPGFSNLPMAFASWVIALAACANGCPGAVPTLELHPDRKAPGDLRLTGLLSGVPAGEARYLRWDELRALPVSRLRVRSEFLAGEQELTVVFLDQVWRALPLAAGADTVLATCRDGYASVYRSDFIQRYRPFLVLEINGRGPERWPPPGMDFNPGPYAILVSAAVVPEVATLLDPGHKKPWGVTALEVARYGDRFRGALGGPRERLSPEGAAGREIWINSCASCHPGPGGSFGGTKSRQPFAVLETLASCRPAFFKGYVRHPRDLNPSARMEAHAHYTDAQLDALAAFVSAGD